MHAIEEGGLHDANVESGNASDANNSANVRSSAQSGNVNAAPTPIPEGGSFGDFEAVSSADYMMNTLKQINLLDNLYMNNDGLARQNRI
jgi:hypothetical protein